MTVAEHHTVGQLHTLYRTTTDARPPTHDWPGESKPSG